MPLGAPLELAAHGDTVGSSGVSGRTVPRPLCDLQLPCKAGPITEGPRPRAETDPKHDFLSWAADSG